MAQQRADFEKHARTWRDILARLSTRGSGNNPMETIIAPRIQGCDTQVAKLSEQITVVDAALAALDDVSFRFDPAPEMSPEQRWMSDQATMTLAEMLGRR